MRLFDAIDEISAAQLLVLMNMNEMQEMFSVDMDELIPAMATWSRDRWQDEAQNVSPWGEKYADAIRIEPVGKTSIVKVFVNENEKDSRSGKPLVLFANMVETGVKSFSIKEGLLNSKRLRVSSSGIKYIIIPFRHRTPTKDRPSSGFSGVLSKKEYAEAKEGMRVDDGPNAGLKRYGISLHGQFFTFRVVSEKSKGWQHPGKSPTPVYSKIQKKVDNMIRESIKRHIEKTIKERYS